jgi:hypothetical protein
MEWLIGIGVVLILDILALDHIASPRTERDRNSWRR